MVSRHPLRLVGGGLVLLILAAIAGIWTRQATPETSTNPNHPTSTTLPGRWKLAFDDEFNGHRLNQHKWQPGWFGTGMTAPVSHNDRQCYSSRQVQVAHGILHLKAIAQRSRCGGTTHPYRSGIVSTNPVALGPGNGYQFKYGVVVVRAKVPNDGRGHCANWSTLWTDGQTWPNDGEIDIMECLAGNTSWYLHSDVPGGAYSVPGDTPRGDWTGWHTFAVDWEPTRATVYYDGHKVGSHTYKVPHENYIVIMNAIRKGSRATLPTDLKVDYVRVWRHSSASTAARLTLNDH